MTVRENSVNYPALLSFFCGFVSLSLEIIWVRLYGFAMMSTPIAFGFVLMAYLVGIALGAWRGGRACRLFSQDPNALWRFSSLALATSAALTLLAPAVFVWARAKWWSNPVVDFVLIALVASVLAYVFPIAHHLGAGPGSQKQGRHFAWVYTSNVMGAALGPLVTGYVLFEYFTLQQTFLVLAAMQFFAVGLLYWFRRSDRLRQLALILSLGSLSVLAWLSINLDPHLVVKRLSRIDLPVGQVVETRSGIITMYPSKGINAKDDAVFGGNVYDGRTNLSIEDNTNGLHRPLMLAALQSEPKRVLMVGLSIGTWLTLINGFPGVEKIDVVEINGGYLKAIQPYGPQTRALRDPRVHLVIDDARRWLRGNQDKRYDLIIMNTTWHWRANSGFLLSNEFLSLVKKHMAPGAVVAFNATGSPDAFFTASQVFNQAYRYDNFIYAADFDFRDLVSQRRAAETYSNVTVDGERLFPENSALIQDLLRRPFVDITQDEAKAGRPLEVITDKNAITEYKYGYGFGRLY